jgi:hypothetical protein
MGAPFIRNGCAVSPEFAIEKFILCAKAVYADDLLFISDSNLTYLMTLSIL